MERGQTIIKTTGVPYLDLSVIAICSNEERTGMAYKRIDLEERASIDIREMLISKAAMLVATVTVL